MGALEIKPKYVYVASSWRCDMQAGVVAMLKAAKIPHYDFKDSKGFHWSETGLDADNCTHDEYLNALTHERSIEGYARDMDALTKADAVVMVLPCGNSAHLEMGYAVATGKRTSILLPQGEKVRPDLMYKMVDRILVDVIDLLDWLGVEN